MIKENLATAGEIAKIQLDAARRIDERMRTMAQAGAGGELTEWASTIAIITAAGGPRSR